MAIKRLKVAIALEKSPTPTHSPWWVNEHLTAHLGTKEIPMNLIWSESVQWLPSYVILKVQDRQKDKDNATLLQFSFKKVQGALFQMTATLGD